MLTQLNMDDDSYNHFWCHSDARSADRLTFTQHVVLAHAGNKLQAHRPADGDNGGGLSVSGGARITANGVMFDNDPGPSGSISLAGNGSITISPPTSGTSKGISIVGNGSLNRTGSSYVPAATLTTTGNGGTSVVWSAANGPRTRQFGVVE